MIKRKLFISAAIVLSVAFAGIYPVIHYHKAEKKSIADSTVTVAITSVGDLMCHIPQIQYATVKSDSFNFSPVFSFIKKYWQNSNLVIGNLETVIAGADKKYSGYPLFNSPSEFVKALKYSGFNLLTTANNHALDRGINGAFNTLEIIRQSGINYEGTFNSPLDKDSIRIFDLQGIKVAVLAYTYGVNGNYIPKGYNFIINLIDSLQIKNDIKTSRKEGAEIVLVYFHFGTQYKRQPDTYQKDIVKKAIQYGADIILGGHTHVLQPCEYYKTNNAKLDSGFVIYSLGNFISNQMWRYSDAGVVLTIKLTKNITTGSISLTSVGVIPTYVFKGKTKEGNKFYILPSSQYADTSYKFLTPFNRDEMKQAFEDSRKILTEYTSKIDF
jgi:poly-gamma-glutamate synthesis protein (capsule biosynthesis protein)